MRIVLALVAAMAASVIGVLLGRRQRPLGLRRLALVIVVAAVAAGVAETGTILMSGAPRWILQPMISGVVLGWVAAFFSGRKPRPPADDDEKPNRREKPPSGS